MSIRPVNPSSLVEKIAEIYGIGTEDMLDFVSLKRGVKKDKEKKKEKKEEVYFLIQNFFLSFISKLNLTILFPQGSPSSYEIIDPCFGDYEEGDPILPFPFPASFSQIFGLELDLSLPPTLSEPVFNLLMAYEKDSKKIRLFLSSLSIFEPLAHNQLTENSSACILENKLKNLIEILSICFLLFLHLVPPWDVLSKLCPVFALDSIPFLLPL